MFELPIQVTVQELVSSRYPGGFRPLSWDERISGIDVVRLSDGTEIRLASDGQQSPPRKGWRIILRNGDEQKGFTWTLYALPKGSEIPDQPVI